MGSLIYTPASSNRPYPRGQWTNHGLAAVIDRQVRIAIRLTAKHRAGLHVAEVDFMLRQATWQGDYQPVTRLSVASKRHRNGTQTAGTF